MTNVVARLLNSMNLSNGTIGALKLTNCALHLENLANLHSVRLNFDRIVVNAKNLSNRAGTNLTAEVALRWDTNGMVQADIKAALLPASAEVALAFHKLHLRPLAPYLEPHLNILVLGSKLGLLLRSNCAAPRMSYPKFAFRETPGSTASRPPRG